MLHPPARYEAGEPFPRIGALLGHRGGGNSFATNTGQRWPDQTTARKRSVPARLKGIEPSLTATEIATFWYRPIAARSEVLGSVGANHLRSRPSQTWGTEKAEFTSENAGDPAVATRPGARRA